MRKLGQQERILPSLHQNLIKGTHVTRSFPSPRAVSVGDVGLGGFSWVRDSTTSGKLSGK